MQVKSYYKTNAEEICQPTEARSTKKGEKMPSKRNSPNGKDPTEFRVGTGKCWLVANCKPFVRIGSLLSRNFFASIKNIGLTWRGTGTFLPPRKAILKVSNKRPICPWIRAIDRQILQPKEHWTQYIQIIFSSINGERERESQKAQQVPKQDSPNLRVCKSSKWIILTQQMESWDSGQRLSDKLLLFRVRSTY